MRFNWNQLPCGSRNGDVIKYSYVLTSSDSSSTNSDSGETTTTAILLDDLHAETEYEFSVAAWTTFGMGPYTKKVETTDTKGKPTFPIHFVPVQAKL